MNKKKKNYVFIISLILTAIIAIWSILFKNSFTVVSDKIFSILTVDFGWSYLLSVTGFVIFSIFIAFSKYGKIKLGADDSVPEYKTVSWFAMLFGAGMGVGLVFWGIAEPLSHFVAPLGMEGGTPEAADFAIRTSFTHWGIHPWATYSVIGLALAYFQYRKGKPALLSSIFEPLIGEKGVNGPLGKCIDILAIFATVAGVTTSLGLGVKQINSGINYLFGVPETLLIQIIIIVIFSVIYIWSAVAGVEKGIKKVSDMNLYLAFGLMVVAVIVGPRLAMIDSFTNGIGQYIGNFFGDSFYTNTYGDNDWVNEWRIFYWSWWIAWAPFVGAFIARISKGRTIREFILGVVIAPAIGSMVWFAIFGTLGIDLGIKGVLSTEILASITAAPETALFVVMEQYPLGSILSIISIVLICTFFVTSANSGTFVLSMLSSNGNLNPPNSKKIVWGVVQSSLAIGLLIAGGLKPLQTISIIAAFPFIFIMVFACISMVKALKQEQIK
ncbi:BCCT family transporter [Sedimentibacter sp. zth1]|uniref:glycine betaine uptake BCCT transporter n=1 Tax=Sedimentibacter sp. zth1 TaxID=2816908 RepID=UPI001A916B09|nr:BCCT family transporter [Sedimentibacter sp. zth1]QSX07348.1 BCCT family transporter [Sedimentibacter sp. zth1]